MGEYRESIAYEALHGGLAIYILLRAEELISG